MNCVKDDLRHHCVFGSKCKNFEATHSVFHPERGAAAPAPKAVDPATQVCTWGKDCRYRDSSCKKMHPEKVESSSRPQAAKPEESSGDSNPEKPTRTKKFYEKAHKPKPQGFVKCKTPTEAVLQLARSGVGVDVSRSTPMNFGQVKESFKNLIGNEPCAVNLRGAYEGVLRENGVNITDAIYAMARDDKAFSRLIKLLAIATGNDTPKPSGKKTKEESKPLRRIAYGERPANPRPLSKEKGERLPVLTEPIPALTDDESEQLDAELDQDIAAAQAAAAPWSDDIE